MQDFKNIKSIKQFYNRIKGKKLLEIKTLAEKSYPNIKLKINKGIVGQVFEAYAGRKPNSNPNPDIEHLGVEFKVLPVRKIANNTLQPKERSKIKAINYNTITKEIWAESDVKRKIDNIIFFVYEQPTGYTYKDLDELVFKGILHYDLAQMPDDHIQIERDWNIIKDKVTGEVANTLSESDGEYLGASTSGTGKQIVYGRLLSTTAKERSYSLKHKYLKYYYLLNSDKLEDSGEDSVNDILSKIKANILGKDLGTLSNTYNVNFNPRNKSAFRHLINKIFNLDNNKLLKELEMENLSIKTIPINLDGYPYEAMSFPKFSLVDLIHEDWDAINDKYDEAVFKNLIKGGFIFITVHKSKINVNNKYIFNDWKEWTINDVFIWKPSDDNLIKIKKEWQSNKKLLTDKNLIVKNVTHANGSRKENNFPKPSESNFIHIRPHAKNGEDLDIPFKEYTNGEIEISWQSFWFNKDFIADLINKHRNNIDETVK